ncbi:transferase family protein [Colletotrichum truncatum]|uniref:Transferase family protein n=1 Tax=Colletotrichum truncatum TaxID=5467 RepID=A0ACC3ZIV7_COLTU|nr:transferase family protein [Colletotrichum truncatum]KAF6785629.1 transferase family protein [Colletotrichum truncatum]
MEPSHQVTDTCLSPLDWLMPRYYMPQIYCFPSGNPGLCESLQHGLAGLVAEVPFLLSGVVSQEHPLGSVALSNPYRTASDIFSWQDLSEKLDYESLKKDHFPLSIFNDNAVIVPNTLKRPLPTPAPVFWSRLTLVRGGAFLYVGLHHAVSDMIGFGSLVKIWSAHCRDGASTAAGFDRTWLDRSPLCNIAPSTPVGPVPAVIPDGLFYEDVSVSALVSPGEGPPQPVPEFTAAIFYFAPEGLERLKRAAVDHLPILGESGVPWVSTSDVLTALLWSAIVWAEQDFSPTIDRNVPSHMAFPVNIRSLWTPALPPDYVGAACGRASAAAPTGDLLLLSAPEAKHEGGEGSNDLGPSKARLMAKVSVAVRAAIANMSEEKMRTAIAFTAAQPDLSRITQRPTRAPMITSWADNPIHDLDWGKTVGRCEAVRFATFPVRVRPIILPRVSARDGGGVEVFLSVDQAEMKRFSESALVKQFGTLRTSVVLGKR